MNTLIKSLFLLLVLSITQFTSIATAGTPCEMWLGHWGNGLWNKNRPGELIVKTVSEPKNGVCKAEIVHILGINPRHPNNIVADRDIDATIKIRNNTLTIPVKTGTIRYKMSKNGSIKGSFKSDWITLYIIK
jgi:hypothetical protein